MERLLVLYFIRAGYLGVTVKTIMEAARSVGAVAGIKSDRMPSLPYEPGRRASATGEPLFGVGAVLICPLGRGRGDHSSLRSILRPVAFRGIRGMQIAKALASGGAAKVPAAVLPPDGSAGDLRPISRGESKVIADPRMKELLSAAIANSNACRNWLSRAQPNLERARVSIAHVIRDVDDLARMLE
jgi:hypothetical protein